MAKNSAPPCLSLRIEAQSGKAVTAISTITAHRLKMLFICTLPTKPHASRLEVSGIR